MSQTIHQAQTVKSILSDTSLPVGERAEPALQALREIDFDQIGEASHDQLRASFEQIGAVADESLAIVAQGKEMFAPEQFEGYEAQIHSLDSLDSRLRELLDSAASRLIEAELDRIVAELDVGFHVLPEDAIREAREHRDLIVPRLIQVLQDVVAQARAGKIPEGQAHFFAVFLLTEFQAKEAFETMREAFSLGDDLPFELFGDAIFDVPQRMLAVLSGDRPDAIEALIDDRASNNDFRWQAVSSYLHLVGEGQIGRDEAVRRLQRSLRRAIDANDEDVVGPLVCELDNYAPVEALPEIREAIERGLVDESMIGMSDIERSIAEGPSRLEERLDRYGPAEIDTLEELKMWAAFQPQPPARKPSSLSSLAPLEAILPPPRFEESDEPAPAKPAQIVASGPRVGRNDPCPCGSGKKFKKCCGSRV